jgi:hypothetical protein
LRMRVRGGTIYLGRADLLHGDLQPRPVEERSHPPEQPAGSDELASLSRWPPGSRLHRRRQ